MTVPVFFQPVLPSRTETTCRSCGSKRLKEILDLGVTPLADRLVRLEDKDKKELAFPLAVVFCEDCSLVQINETVDPEILFADHYPYYSSFSPALMDHSAKNVKARLAERSLGPESLVMELASNDGYLLKNYVEADVPVLGIDPADGPVAAARKVGVRTVEAFFTTDLAREIVEEYGQADVVHANNVLAHVADTNGFVQGLRTILKPDGVAVIEVPYLKPLIERVEFDTIYHEHLCYFSVTALTKLFQRYQLYLNRVEPLSIHGGSIRIFVEPFEKPDKSVIDMLSDEREIGLDSLEYFRDFSDRVSALRKSLVAMIDKLRAEGKSIAAYGAAAKGATLLNFCGLTDAQIDFVVDRNTNKHGLLMPGAHLPVRPTEALAEAAPDVTLMLAWNFKDEIVEQQSAYRENGGRFIIPVPHPEII